MGNTATKAGGIAVQDRAGGRKASIHRATTLGPGVKPEDTDALELPTGGAGPSTEVVRRSITMGTEFSRSSSLDSTPIRGSSPGLADQLICYSRVCAPCRDSTR